MQITNEARDIFEELFEEHQVRTLRLFVAGYGCGAPQVGLSLDPSEESDELVDANGITVAVDEELKALIPEIRLDVQSTESGMGIVISGLPQSDCC